MKIYLTKRIRVTQALAFILLAGILHGNLDILAVLLFIHNAVQVIRNPSQKYAIRWGFMSLLLWTLSAGQLSPAVIVIGILVYGIEVLKMRDSDMTLHILVMNIFATLIFGFMFIF